MRSQIPPCLVVIIRRDFAGKHFPAPLVDQFAEWQEGDFVERQLHQLIDHRFVAALGFTDQAQLPEIPRRHRQLQRVAYAFVKTIVGAGAKQDGLVLVHQVIVNVAQLVMQCDQRVFGLFHTLFDTHIVAIIERPGAGVADDIPVSRLAQQRTFPECVR